jgi:hypothetical protein
MQTSPLQVGKLAMSSSARHCALGALPPQKSDWKWRNFDLAKWAEKRNSYYVLWFLDGSALCVGSFRQKLFLFGAGCQSN